jgi:hypothetical protein
MVRPNGSSPYGPPQKIQELCQGADRVGAFDAIGREMRLGAIPIRNAWEPGRVSCHWPHFRPGTLWASGIRHPGQP